MVDCVCVRNSERRKKSNFRVLMGQQQKGRRLKMMARRVAWKREHKASYSRIRVAHPAAKPSMLAKGNSSTLLSPEHCQLQRPQQALFPGVIKVRLRRVPLCTLRPQLNIDVLTRERLVGFLPGYSGCGRGFSAPGSSRLILAIPMHQRRISRAIQLAVDLLREVQPARARPAVGTLQFVASQPILPCGC